MIDEALDHQATTCTTRVWGAKAIEDARKLILAQPDLLSPELRELQRLAKTEDGGFPRWLIHCLAARHFLRWIESGGALTKQHPFGRCDDQACDCNSGRTPAEPAKPKRGSR